MGNTIWHTLPIPDLERVLDTGKQGLSEDEAAQRLQKYGPNELEQKGRKSVWSMLIEQFKDFMVIILIIAAIISGLLGEISDSIIILAIIFLNAVLGIIQENKAEESLSALKRMAAPMQR
jgi:Ca2+-transporting ATPase